MNPEAAEDRSHGFQTADWLVLAGLVALAASTRTVYYLQSLAWPYFDQPVSDAAMYLDRARGLLNGSWPPPNTAHSQGPLYPYVLAAILKLTDGYRLMLVIQLILGCASVGLVYGIARRITGRTGATVASLGYIGYGPLLSTEGKLLTESMSIFLALLALCWLGRLTDRVSWWRLVLAGFCLGLASLLRPPLMPAIPAIGAWIWWTHRAARARGILAAGLLCASAALPIAPFTRHNYPAEGEIIAITSAGGITFWLGNNPLAAGSLSLGGVISGEVSSQHEEQLSAAERVLGRKLTSGQASRFWYGRGLAFIRKYPRQWAWILWRKFRLFFSNEEVANVYAFASEQLDISILRATAIPFALIGAAGLVGVILLIRRPEAQPIVIMLALGFASCMVFYTSSRFRLPVVPLLVILGGCGIGRVLAWYHNGDYRRMAAAVAAFVILAGAMWWPVGGPLPPAEWFGRRSLAHMLSRNGDYERARALLAPQLEPNVPNEERAAAWLMLGRVEMERRRYPQAVEAFGNALKIDPTTLTPHRYMAIANYSLGQYAKAIESAKVVLKQNPRDMECRLLIGECLIRQQKWSEAIEEARKAQAVEPRNLQAMHQLGQAYYGLHRYEQAAECFQTVLKVRPEPLVVVNFALCLNRMGRTAEARQVLQRLLSAEPDHPQAKALLRDLGGAAAP